MNVAFLPAGAILQLDMFLTNNVWLQFFLFWLFGLAMTSFACCTSVFLQTSQSAGNAGLAMILVSGVLRQHVLRFLCRVSLEPAAAYSAMVWTSTSPNIC
jgi:hypothetical protein